MKSKPPPKRSSLRGAKARPKTRSKGGAKAAREPASKSRGTPARRTKTVGRVSRKPPAGGPTRREPSPARAKKGARPKASAASPRAFREAGQATAVEPPKVPALYSGPVKRVKLPEGYRPSEDEPFMNPHQLEYFRQKLLSWRTELIDESQQTLAHLKESLPVSADLADRAMIESERAVELRTRDRERKLIAKIDAALKRIDEGTYGYCEMTGQPIGLKRLEARPIATLGIEAQERHERMEKIYRED